MRTSESPLPLVPRARHARARTAPKWVTSAWFWVRRYLPAELAGTTTMIVAGIAVASLAVPPIVVGIVAAQGENIGFYAVAGIVVWREQRVVLAGRDRLRVLIKVVALMLLEFGPAELLDTLLLRPLFLTVAVHLIPEVGWALIIGKLAADVAFYVLAATAFRVTEVTGVRGAEPAVG